MNKDPELLKILHPIQDPELFISIVELGLIYGIEKINPKTIDVEFTLTTPACPLGPQLLAQIEETLCAQVSGIENVNIRMVWEPCWDPKVHCSEEAKMQLGIF